jgi:hypothetical protein
MNTPPKYPKGDLRRMLAVLAAIDALGLEATLGRIVERSGVDKNTVTTLVAHAAAQAGVHVSKSGTVYRLEDWGPVLRKKGAHLALQGALNAPIVDSPRITGAEHVDEG